MGVLVLFALKNFGQTKRIPLTESSIVKDSLGNVYSYQQWSAMVKDGSFILQKSKTGEDEYVLSKRQQATPDDNKLIYGKRAGNYIGKSIKFPYMSDLNGKKYIRESLKDKIVVLNFWFVRCAPCLLEMPVLNQLYEKYNENPNVVFLAICLDSKDTIVDFLEKIPFNYKIVPSGLEIATTFDVNSYPTNIIIEKGVVKYSTSGYSKKNLDKAEQILKKSVANIK